MSSRGHRSICREGVYYLLMVAAVFLWAMLGEANLLLLVGGMLCAPLLINWHLCKSSLRGIEVRRRSIRTATAGHPFHVEIEVTNTRRRANWGIRVTDQIQSISDDNQRNRLQPRLFFGAVPAVKQVRLSYRLSLPRRGLYRLGPLRVTSRFPFGLFRYTQTVPAEAELTIHPPIGHLSQAWRRRYFPVSHGVAGSRRPGRAPGDFFAVREWQSGDSSRWVHWRRSARQGQLIVRQFEQPSDRRLVLLVDLWQPSNPTTEDLDNVELIVSFAATVLADICRRPGYRLNIGFTGQPPQWSNGVGAALLMPEFLGKLAVAQASNAAELADLIKLVQGEIPGHAEVILISPRAGAELNRSSVSLLKQQAKGPVRVISPTDSKFLEYFKAN